MQATKQAQVTSAHTFAPPFPICHLSGAESSYCCNKPTTHTPRGSACLFPSRLAASEVGRSPRARRLHPSPARTLAPLPAAASPSPSSRRASPGIPFPSTIAPPLDAEEEEAAASRGRELASRHPPHRRARRSGGFLCGLSPAGRRIRRELPGGPALRAEDGTLSPD